LLLSEMLNDKRDENNEPILSSIPDLIMSGVFCAYSEKSIRYVINDRTDERLALEVWYEKLYKDEEFPVTCLLSGEED